MRTGLLRSGRSAVAILASLVAFVFTVEAQPNPVITPDTITWPATVLAGKTRNDLVILKNTGDQLLHVDKIEIVPDSANPPKAPWLTVETFGLFDIPAGDSIYLFVHTYGDPELAGVDICRPGRIRVVSSAPSPRDTLYCYVCILVRPSSTLTSGLDTLATACTDLVVGSNGNFGNGGVGSVNMDYFGSADCDFGPNSRGNSKLYIFDGSPIIIRKPTPTTYVASWSMYGDNRFVRAPGGKPESTFSTISYNAYTTGTLLTADSLVKVEITWYAPVNPDSCNFIAQRILVFPAVNGTSVSNLQIGQAFDFDIPTDSGSANDVGGTDITRKMIWQRGFNSLDTVDDCADNARRYGGARLLLSRMKNPTMFDSLYGGGNYSAAWYFDPFNTFVPESLSALMRHGGYLTEPGITDMVSLLTYRSGNNGWTLPANDTLSVYSAIATVNTAASPSAGLDSLKRAMEKANLFVRDVFWFYTCCSQYTGNVNLMGIVDLADLSCLVSYLTGGGYVLQCKTEADVNASRMIDLADLSALVSYLTGGGYLLPYCP